MRSEARSEVATYGRFTTFERPPMFQFNLCELYVHQNNTFLYSNTKFAMIIDTSISVLS